ncbi:protein FAM135B [Amia ocellicauda]|uniref:protein FAM135B n=1 Tax=Amia ocellicauda TaxID=2972642 RepID=UPI00346433EA
MSEVQGTVEFSVELHKFHNVDLFQRGFYQVRAGLKISSRIPHRLIATTPGNTGESSSTSACVVDCTVFSRIFQILYRNEEIAVNDTMNFKVHLLLDGERVEEALSEVDFQLKLDLHFTDNEQQLSDIGAVPLISSRTLGLHFHPRRGLHHHVPVMFDYFHLSVISVSIHGSLVALHQPLISFARSGKGSWLGKGSPENGADQSAMSLETLMFGAGYCKPVLTEGSFYVPSENCMQRAYTWHRRLCRLLLAAHRGLRTYFVGLMKEIPEVPQVEIEELPIEETLTQLSIELQVQNSHDKVAEQISRDLTQLCSHLTALWSQFLEAVVPQAEVMSYLVQEHHTLRVRRFSEAYFFTEHPKIASLTFQEELIQRHSQIASEVRSSEYLTRMPPLPVECLDIDGDWNTLPIIFEDRYVENPRADQNLDSVTSAAPIVPSSPESNETASSDTEASAVTANTACMTAEHASETLAINENLSQSDGSIDLPTYVSLIEHCESNNNLKEFDPSETNSRDSQLKEPIPSDLIFDETDEHTNTGLTYIEVRPSDMDPYRGEVVLVVTSNQTAGLDLNSSDIADIASHTVDLEENGPESKVCIKTEQNDTNETEENVSELNVSDSSNSKVTTPHPVFKVYRNEDMLLTSLSVVDYPASEQCRTPTASSECDTDKEDMHIAGKGRCSSSSKVMKRSSSVISDSGIESEPSSVAWPDVRLRPQDISGDRDILQHLVRRHAVHRNSLEGCQTESNASLPSGIQASLTSISSLPYEEEEQVELSKLTKSVSAPQISSPEDTEEDQETANKDPQSESDITSDSDPQSYAALVRNAGRQFDHPVGHNSSLDDILEGDMPDGAVFNWETYSNQQERMPYMESYDSSKDAEGPAELELQQSQVNLQEAELVLSSVPEVLLFQQFVDEGGLHESVFSELSGSPGNIKNDNVIKYENTLAYSQDSPHCSYEAPVPDQKEYLLNIGETGASLCNTDTDSASEANHNFHQIELNEQVTVDQVLLDRNKSQHKSQDTDKENHNSIKTDVFDHQAFAGQGKSSKIPSSGLAFVNRKVVEVVNLSVSCAPTCLPFSSVLRDSPSVSGISVRQATSPITRQPLGSFGVVSSSSFCTDEESNERMLNFYKAKDDLLKELNFQGTIYSDLPQLASDVPYFPPEEDDEEFDDGIHLVVCVHGLDGNSADLRLVKTFIELGLPGSRLDFLMSERNQTDTFADFDTMTDRLLDEIIQHIQLYNLTIARISFIGHSLGNVIIRSVLTRPRFRYYLSKLHTFLSLSGPHLGTLYNNSTLVSTGLWLMQKLKKSGSLLQLTFRDHSDPRRTFLYLLSQKPGLQYFKNVVLVASPQDRYVPFHSARIEMCRTALKDRTTGPVYTEMINNLLQPLLDAKDCKLIRQNVFHALPNTANTLIGRAAHIAVLDSELFLEKFFLVAGLNYFK